MSDNTIEPEQTEAGILSYQVSDDVLEIAAGTRKEKALLTVASAIICLPFAPARSKDLS